MHKIDRFGITFDVVSTDLTTYFWRDHFLKGWEQSTFDFILPRLDKNKVFIDIGAWIGPISLVASHFSRKCICFEPDEVAYKEFRDNIKLNGINNIILENKAISIHSNIKLGAYQLGKSDTRDSCLENSFEVNCLNPSEIFDKFIIKQNEVSVIKIDIEGHEQVLLKNHSLLWDLNVPMQISLHPGYKINTEQYFEDIIPFLIKKNIEIENISQRGDFFDVTCG